MQILLVLPAKLLVLIIVNLLIVLLKNFFLLAIVKEFKVFKKRVNFLKE